jgi:hypothetical protein
MVVSKNIQDSVARQFKKFKDTNTDHVITPSSIAHVLAMKVGIEEFNKMNELKANTATTDSMIDSIIMINKQL